MAGQERNIWMQLSVVAGHGCVIEAAATVETSIDLEPFAYEEAEE
jgi:hypothetical protein